MDSAANVQFWGYVLVVLMLAHGVLRWYMDERHERLQRGMGSLLREMHGMMAVWVETWGDPPEQVKAKLKKVAAASTDLAAELKHPLRRATDRLFES
jgi:hypothetical protein